MSIIKVKTGGITADAITDALIADDVVGTEHLTANEVDTTALGADAVTAAQIADNAVSEEHLDVTAITGHTAETSIADGDTILIHDASASALRKMTKANFVSGIGGTNTPAFLAIKTQVQDCSDNTYTKITFDTEKFDTDNTFASNKFTPGVSGKYYIFANVGGYPVNDVGKNTSIRIYKNGSVMAEHRRGYTNYELQSNGTNTLHISAVIDSDTDDYFEIYWRINTDNGVDARVDYNASLLYTYFGAYKIIE